MHTTSAHRAAPGRRRRLPGLLLPLLAATALALSACAGGDNRPLLERARADGITIGIADERPYGYEEDGEATGQAPELAREVLRRMGITTVRHTVTDFGDLIDDLTGGELDIIAAGMFITPERARDVLFADPDHCVTTAFAVPTGNPRDLSDFVSVISAGATIGVLAGAVEGDYAAAAGVPVDRIRTFATMDDLTGALTGGEVDAVALTALSIRREVTELPGFEATPGFVPVVDGREQLGCGAFGFRREDRAFRDAFNEELAALEREGAVLPIVAPFGFTRAEIDAAAGVTAEQLARAPD